MAQTILAKNLIHQWGTRLKSHALNQSAIKLAENDRFRARYDLIMYGIELITRPLRFDIYLPKIWWRTIGRKQPQTTCFHCVLNGWALWKILKIKKKKTEYLRSRAQKKMWLPKTTNKTLFNTHLASSARVNKITPRAFGFFCSFRMIVSNNMSSAELGTFSAIAMHTFRSDASL